MSTETPNLKLQNPDFNERNWHTPMGANLEALDSASTLSALAVTLHENPSATLTVDIAPGGYVKADGTLGSYAGGSSIAITASSTRYVWITDAGAATVGSAWPSTPHVRLAVVVAGASSISSITDARSALIVAAPAQGPFTSSFVATSTTLGSSPSTSDVAAVLNSLIAALKARGSIL